MCNPACCRSTRCRTGDVCGPGARCPTASGNIGVLLIDARTGRAWVRLRARFRRIADPTTPKSSRRSKSTSRPMHRRSGAEAFLQSLEDSLSNALRVSERRSVAVDAFTRVAGASVRASSRGTGASSRS